MVSALVANECDSGNDTRVSMEKISIYREGEKPLTSTLSLIASVWLSSRRKYKG